MAQPEILFADPVRLQITPWRQRTVLKVSDAAHLLLREWPTPQDDFATYAHEFAMWACLKALQGDCSPEFAGTMFVFAARDAGIFSACNEANEPARLAA